MALKFVKDRSFWWPVIVSVPGDGGKKEKHEFTVKIKDHQPVDYVKALSEGGEELVEYVTGLVTDWKGIEDDNGELPCTEESKAFVFSKHYMFSGLLDAIRKIQTDEPEAKN